MPFSAKIRKGVRTIWIHQFGYRCSVSLSGHGVVAANSLRKSKSEGAGWVTIALGWGAAVTLGVYASSFLSLAHLNPAVSIAMAVAGEFSWSLVLPYSVAQIAGGIVGAALVWLNY